MSIDTYVETGEMFIRWGDRVIECYGVRIPWGRGEELQIICVYRPPTAPLIDMDTVNTERLVEALRGIEGKGSDLW